MHSFTNDDFKFPIKFTPLFIILKQRGIISVYIKKWIASESSPFTNAPITPKLVTLKFSNGFALLLVFKNGYKNNGIWAKIKN